MLFYIHNYLKCQYISLQKGWMSTPEPRLSGSIALPHQCIDQLDRFRESVSYVDELLRGHDLMTPGQDQQDFLR
jgi:hypothetical protein